MSARRRRDRARGNSDAPVLSRSRRATFMALTLFIPMVLLAVAELSLRALCRGCAMPLFVSAEFPGGRYEVANRNVGQRWFAGLESPPSPMPEPFATAKPDRAFRIFVLGESSTAGFPYPRNATFSRMLRDALRDVLPDDSVEVVNLGIAATNSFTMLDMAREVARERPDAVLIYAGHNEYYGALGVGWRERGLDVPEWAARGYLSLLRLRLVTAMRRGVVAAQRGLARGEPNDPASQAVSLMEVLGRGQRFELGGASYDAGVSQFQHNLESLVDAMRGRGIPVLVGSLASNLRDQAPFAAVENEGEDGAVAAWEAARTALDRGDTTEARALFEQARDLDVVRFRAPGAFNDVIRAVAGREGVAYVPVEEAFAAASPGGIPGANLFLEHVHPTRAGYALIARTFFDAIARKGLLGERARPERLATWPEYIERQAITALDERIALHITRALTARWPFVPRDEQRDYRGTYTPAGLVDSLAFAVSRGFPWEEAKLRLAADYERREHHDSAAAEYAGLARDAPLFDEPRLLRGRALMAVGRLDEAEQVLRSALRIRTSAEGLATLGALAVERDSLARAVELFNRSLAVQPDQPAVLYQLSLAHGLRRDLPNARATALRLARVAPRHPGLAEWLRLLGLR